MTKDSAMEAIEHENKSQLLDKLIAVRTAVKKGEGESSQPTTTPPTTQAKAPAKVHSRPAAPNIGPMKQQKVEPLGNNFNHTIASNHIEIMAMSRNVTVYAENIESYLKERKLKVDLLYPNPNVSMPNLLETIKSRGTLFVLEVDLNNVENETVTVYMLHSDPIKWQRNMQVKDALLKVQEDSEKYIQSNPVAADTFKKAFPSQSAGTSSSFDPSEDPFVEMQNYLRDLIRKQQIDTAGMDAFIEKCKKMRKALAVIENPDADPEEETPEVDPAEQEVQRKINDIIKSENYLDKISGKREPFKMTKERLELLQDPKIERALDTLLQPDIFNTLDLSFIKDY